MAEGSCLCRGLNDAKRRRVNDEKLSIAVDPNFTVDQNKGIFDCVSGTARCVRHMDCMG